MENNFKRFLSLMLAFVMVFGMLPANVFATGGDTIDVVDVNVEPEGDDFNGYTDANGLWGEVWGNASESFVIKALDANGNEMGSATLNNVGGIIDGDVNVTWHLYFDAASNADEYWDMEWTTAPTVDNMPAKVELWVDGVKVSGGDVKLNGPDDLNKIVAVVSNADGKITSNHTNLNDAIASVQDGETVTVLEDITFTTGANGSTNGISYTGGASFSLDLNGKTLSSNLGNIVLRFKIGEGNSVADTEVEISIKNGKIVSGSSNWCGISAATVNNNKLTLNLNDLDIEANKAGDWAVKSWAGAVVKATGVDVVAKYAGGFGAVGGEIVLTDCTVDQKGLHTAPYMSTAVAVNNMGKMTVNSGTYSSVPLAATDGNNQGTSHGSWMGGIMNSGGTMIINGGTFSNGNIGGTATNPRELLIVGANGENGEGVRGEIVINGGTFNSIGDLIHCETIWGTTAGKPYDASMGITITDGNFTGVSGKTIGGCDPVSTGNKAEVEISGGSYAEGNKIDDTYLAPGFELSENGNGSIGVKEKTFFCDAATKTATIKNLDGLKQFRDEVNGGNTFAGWTVVLAADIDLADEEWAPIGYMGNTFKGTFDGGKFTISNLKITKDLTNTAANNGIGFFGRTDDTAVIKNLTIENVDITGSLYVGAVVGFGYTGKSIENVTVKGDIAIDAWWYAGVIGGNGYMNLIDDCHVIGNEGSYIKGNEGSYIGGIWGFRGEGNNKITNCSVEGLEIMGVDRVGGICGIGHYGNTISGCEAEDVTVTATDPDATTVGLIVGACQGTASEPTKFENNTLTNTTAQIDNGDGTYTKVENEYGSKIDGSEAVTNYAAKIGNKTYLTLAAAVAAAKAGDEIVLLADVPESVTLPAGVIFNGNGKTVNGTLTAGGDLTFKGHTKVTAFSAGYYNRTITIGAGASLTVNNRITVSYGNVFNITGSVADAKTADKTTITPSLNLIGGISYNGNGGGAQFNATNAYIILGDSSTKNSGATGEFNMNFDNCIVDYTKVLKTYNPTVSSLAPKFNFNAKDSVVNFASHLELWLDATTMTLDNTDLTVGGSFANAGKLNVENGSNFVVMAPIMSSHGGNTGTIAVKNASFELKDSNEDWQNAGTMTAEGTGKLITNDFKNVNEGAVVLKSKEASFEGKQGITVTSEVEGYDVAYNETTGKYEFTKAPVAQIGEQKFETLEAAFKAATSGCTIEILQNVTIDYKWDCRNTGAKFTVPVTINGNGKTIKFTNTVYDGGNYMAAFRFEADATVKNLTIDMSEALSGFAGRFRAISAKGNLTVDGCTFIGNGSTNNTRAIIFGEGAGANTANLAVSVTNSTFNGWKRGVSDNENAQDVKSVTVTGNTFEDASVYVSANETVTFTGNKINGSAVVNIKSYSDVIDNVTVSGNTLTGGATGMVQDVASYDNIQPEFSNDAPVSVTNGQTVKYFNSLDTAIAAAQAGDTIELLADVEATEVILIDKSLTINGNDHKVTSSASRVFRVTTSNVEVTMNDVNVVSAAVRVGTNDIRGIAIDPSLTNVKLTLNDCSVDFTSTSACDWAYGVNIAGSGNGHTLTINGGSYEGANVINVYGANNTVTVKDATLTSLYPDNELYYGACIWVQQKQGSSVEATGNTFEASNAIAFNLGTGTALTESNNTDNTKYVVAKIGTALYTSLAEAFAAAQNGDKIVLLQNFALSETVKVPAFKARTATGITLDLNGKTITGTDNATGNFALIELQPGAELTVTGNGAITLKATNNRAFNSYSSVISNQRGKLTVNGGTIEHLGGTDMAYGIDILTNTGVGDAEAIINGGTIKSTYRAIRQFLNSTKAKNILTINGGTIEGGNKSVWMQDANKYANPGKLTIGANAAIKGNVYVTASAGSTEWPVELSVADAALKDGATVLTSNIPATYVVEKNNGVWGVSNGLKGSGTEADPYQIGTLSELILFRDSVNDGETKYNNKNVWVALSADIDMAGETWSRGIGDGINATFDGCFDGKGHTIKNLNMTVTPDSDGYLCGGLFGYIYKSGVIIRNLTIENASINCGDAAGHNVGVLVGFAMKCSESLIENVTIKGDVKVDAPNAYGVGAIVGYSMYNGFEIKNCVVDANDGSYIKGYSFVGGIIGYGYTDTTITNCSVKNIDIIATSMDAGAVAGLLNNGGKITDAVVNGVDVSGQANVGSVLGAIAGEGILVESNGAEPVVGGSYATSKPVEAKIGNKYYTTFAAAYAAANAGDTVELLAPIVVAAGETLNLNKAVTITYTSDKMGEAMITNNGDLTLDAVKVVYTYTGAADSAYSKGNYTIANRGKLTIVNATVENATAAMKHASYAVDNYSGSELVMKSGLILNTNNYAMRMFSGGNVTVDGGEINGTRAIWMQAAGSDSAVAPAMSLTVNDGKLTATGEPGYKLAVYSYNYGNSLENVSITVKGGEIDGDIALSGGKNKTVAETVTITGGSITNLYSYAADEVAAETVNVSGGTFANEVALAYCAEGYAPAKNADGTYGVVEQTTVTITVGNATMVAGNSLPEFTYTSDVEIDGLTVEFSTAADGKTAGEFEINATVTASPDPKYVYEIVPGKLTVEAAKVRVYQKSDAKVVYFTDLAEAVAFAAAQKWHVPVYLLGNITIDKPIVITDSNAGMVELQGDLTGARTYTLSSTHAGEMFKVEKGATLSVKNLKVNAQGDAFYVNGGELNLNCHSLGKQFLEVTSQTGNCVYIRGGSANVNGAKLTSLGEYPAIQGNGTYVGDVTINTWNIGDKPAPEISAPNADFAIYWPQNGKLTVEAGTITGKTALYAKSGTIVINGGEFVATGEKADFKHYSNGAYATGDTVVIEACVDAAYETPNVTINGGTFKSANADAVKFYACNTAAAAADVMDITAGSFSTAVPEEYCADGYIPTNKLADGTFSVKQGKFVARVNGVGFETIAEAIAAANNDETVVMISETDETEVVIDKAIELDSCGIKLPATVTLADLGATVKAAENQNVVSGVKDYKVKYDNGTYSLVKAVIAKIGNVGYSTLAEAVAAAQPGQTIKLVCDAEGAGVVIDKNLTIDFAGYTYTLIEGVGSTGTETNGFQILKGNTVRIQGGTLNVAESAKDEFYILIQNYANLTVYNMTLDGTNLDKYSGTDGDSYTLSNNCGSVAINKSTVKANDEGKLAFAFDVCDKTAWGYTLPIVTVYPSAVIEGKIEAAAKVGNSYYATLAHTVENAVAGKTITLQGNISGAGVVIDKDTIIDFNGYTYTLTEGVGSTGTESNGFQILKGNKVTLKNGTLKVADSAADKFYILIQNYANLTVNNMTLDGTNLDKWSKTDGDSYTLSNNSGKVTIGAGTKIIANNDGSKAFAFDACDKSAWGYELPVVTVNKTAVIEGNIEAAAKIGNVYYATLQQAIEAAASGKTITLVTDINLNKVETVLLDGSYNTYFKVEGKTVTIDLNGKTISGAYTDTSKMLVGVFSTENGGHLTLTGNGTVNLTEGEGATVYSLMSNYDRDCTITIENGTYTLNSAKDCLLHSSPDKGLIIKGGNFELGNVAQGHWSGNRGNGSPWIINVNGQNAGAAVVSGGTYNFNVAKQYYALEVSIEDANGNLSYVVDNGDGTWTVTGKTAEVGIVTGTWNATYLYGYATFKDAVASIVKGAPETTIKLLKDITVKGQFIGHSYAQKVVIDLNGYKMSSTDKTLTVYRGGTEVTIKNGTVHGNSTGGTIQVTYGGKLTLGENTTITSGGSANAIKVDANSTLIVADETVKVLGGKADLIVADGAKVEISAGYFKYPVKAEWCAEGFIPTEKLANGYYSVTEDPSIGMAAQIGNAYYETLQAAIEAAKDGDKIIVLTDIAVDSTEVVTNSGGYSVIYNIAEKDIIIDLNGKKIEATVNAADVADAKNGFLMGVFATDTNGSLTLTGEGSVTVNSNGTDVYSLAAAYGEGGKLEINGGTYFADAVNASGSLIYSQYDEVVTINGGTYTLGNLGEGANGSPWLFNAKGQNNANIVVNGGTFAADIQHQYYPFEVKMPKELALSKGEDGMYTVVPAVAYVNEQEWSGKWYTNNVGYATLEEAVAAAEGVKTKVVGKVTYTSECEVVTILNK